MTIAAIASVGSSLLGGRSAKKAAKKEARALEAQGKAEQEGAYFEAAQMETAAGQQQAVAQRNAQEELRKSEVLQSRALAVAGASGAGVNDPTVLKILSDFAAEGQLAADTQLYSGDEAARNLKLQAKVTRWQGGQARAGRGVQSQAAKAKGRAAVVGSLLDAAGTGATWYASTPKAPKSAPITTAKPSYVKG